MTSEKQRAANRRNAAKSTGPKTLQGKANSRRNAVRDGLTGQVTTLADEERPVFENIRASFLADFHPQTTLESTLVDAVAWDTWRLNRLRAVETNIYTLGLEENEPDTATVPPSDFDVALSDARTFRSHALRFDLMGLYEQRITRNIHRNLTALRNLQAERKNLYQSDLGEEVLIARTHEFNDMPIQVTTRPSKNGFVFSNEEVAVAAVRSRYIDTAKTLLKNSQPGYLLGSLYTGTGDSFLEKLSERVSVTTEQYREFQAESPEARAVDRLAHPEAYGVRAQKLRAPSGLPAPAQNTKSAPANDDTNMRH